MPGYISFGSNKNTNNVNVITDLPTYKVIQDFDFCFDLNTNIPVGELMVLKQIYKDNHGNVLQAIYSYSCYFYPVKGIFGFNFCYTADELSANGETEKEGEYFASINQANSSGVFLGEQGNVRKVKDASVINKYYVDYPYGYSNSISNTQAPLQLNMNEYIKIDSIDTPSWVIGADPTELVCVENGKWNWIVQYQLIAIKNGLAALNGFINVNGVDDINSDAESTTTVINQNNVLGIGYSKYFNKGDKIRFGIRSSNGDDSSELKVIVKTTVSPTGLSTPAVIICASRLY